MRVCVGPEGVYCHGDGRDTKTTRQKKESILGRPSLWAGQPADSHAGVAWLVVALFLPAAFTEVPGRYACGTAKVAAPDMSLHRPQHAPPLPPPTGRANQKAGAGPQGPQGPLDRPDQWS